MLIDEAFATALTTALPTVQVYAHHLPQSKYANFPNVVYQVVNTKPLHVLGAYAGLSNSLIRLQVWGLSAVDVATLSESVRTAFDGTSGTWGTVVINSCIKEQGQAMPPEVSDDGSDTWHYRLVDDYRVWHYEAPAQVMTQGLWFGFPRLFYWA